MTQVQRGLVSLLNSYTVKIPKSTVYSNSLYFTAWITLRNYKQIYRQTWTLTQILNVTIENTFISWPGKSHSPIFLVTQKQNKQ